MNLAFYIPVLNIGGAERVVVDLLNTITNQNFNKNRYFLITDTNKSLMINQLSDRVTLIHLNSDFTLIRRLFHLKKVITKYHIDIISSHLTHANLYACALKLFINVKVIITEHSITSVYFSRKNIRNKLIKFLIFILFKYSDKVICVSKLTKDDLVKNFSIDIKKCHVIYNPLDFNNILLKSNGVIDENIYSKIKNNKYFITIGRLEPEKNHIDLILYIKDFLIQNDSILLIVGDGSLRNQIENIINQEKLSNYIILTGFTSNPYPLLKHSIGYIHSSLFEGFGLTIIEALFLKKDVLVFDNQVLREIVDNIPNGYIYHNKNEFLNYLNNIWDNPGNFDFPNKLLEKYSLERIANNYLDIYYNIQ